MRKYYFLFSLDLIFLLSFFYFFITKNKEKYITTYHAIKIFLPRDAPSADKHIVRFSAPDILKEYSKRKFINIFLIGEEEQDYKRIEFIKLRARELKYTYDTIHIIKVTWTDDLTYGKFIKLISLMYEDDHKGWMVYENSLYIYILGEEI